MRSLIDLYSQRIGTVEAFDVGKVIHTDTEFVTLYKEGDWVVGYYGHKETQKKHFLNIYNTRSGRSFAVTDLVPAHIKSKYIFWKNMLVE